MTQPPVPIKTRQRKAWHPLAKGGGGQSWPWPMTKNLKGVSPHHPQSTCEVWKWLDKTVVRILPTRSIHSAEVDLNLWPCDPKSKGFRLSSSKPCHVWKWFGKTCSRYRVHKLKCNGHTNPLTQPKIPPPNGFLYPLKGHMAVHDQSEM